MVVNAWKYLTEKKLALKPPKNWIWVIWRAKIETHFLTLGFSDIACGGWSPGSGVVGARDWVGKKRKNSRYLPPTFELVIIFKCCTIIIIKTILKAFCHWYPIYGTLDTPRTQTLLPRSLKFCSKPCIHEFYPTIWKHLVCAQTPYVRMPLKAQNGILPILAPLHPKLHHFPHMIDPFFEVHFS